MNNTKTAISCRFLYLGIFVLIFTSCVNDADQDILRNKEDISPFTEVKTVDGHLVFGNQEAFDNYVTQKNEITNEALSDLEKALEFQSMRSLFNQAFISQLAHLEANSSGHSEFVTRNANYLEITEDGDISPKSYRYDVTVALDKNGFVQIGNVLYQYGTYEVKAVPLFEQLTIPSKEEIMITNETNEAKNIYISEVISLIPAAASGRTTFDEDCTSGGTLGSIRGRAKLRAVQNYTWTWDFVCGCVVGTLNYWESTLEYTTFTLPHPFFGSYPIRAISSTYNVDGVSTTSNFNYAINSTETSRFETAWTRTSYPDPVDVTNFSATFTAWNLPYACTVDF